MKNIKTFMEVLKIYIMTIKRLKLVFCDYDEKSLLIMKQMPKKLMKMWIIG